MDAESFCATLGSLADVIYFPSDQTQNVIFRSAMMEKFKDKTGGHRVWIGVKSLSGEWLLSNGAPLTPVQEDWAPGQPNAAGGSCVVADKALGSVRFPPFNRIKD